MRNIVAIAFLLPLFANSQNNITAVGHWERAIEETAVCDGTWKILAMDAGTTVSITKMNLSLAIAGTNGDNAIVGAGCHIDGDAGPSTTAYVATPYPIVITEGSMLLIKCPPGKFIRLSRPQ